MIGGLPLAGYAQSTDSSRPPGQDSGRPALIAPHARQDSANRARHRRLYDSAARMAARPDTGTHVTAVAVPPPRDSVARDSTANRVVIQPLKPAAPARDEKIAQTRPGIPKTRVSRDLLFYVIICLALWMGVLKSGYNKYYNDLFTVFFRSSLRQHQIREQLVQARLPSLLFNLFFVGSAGTFLYLLLPSVLTTGRPQWELWVGSIGAVAILYLAKFLGLKLSGWIFGMPGAVDTYIFIVFLVNKIMGVALLPVIIILAFSREDVQSVGATLGLLLVAGMLIYRFIRSYRPVWEEVQMDRFHFFLYLCAFEIAPLLLIYKTMLKLL